MSARLHDAAPPSPQPDDMSAYVLYVDDDPGNLTVFEAACAGDFNVLTAPGGPEALELFKQHEIGVLLTDQRMPGMTGVELAEAVRAEHPDTIRMLVTAYSDLNAAVDAINRGHVRRYLRKPWEPHEILQTLKEAFELYDMTRRARVLERRLMETERVYALGVVAAGIAHELRNPISWLSANLGLMRDGIRATTEAVVSRQFDPPSLAARLREMEEALTDCLEGTRRIAEIARGIDLSTRSPVGDERVDVGEVVTTMLKSVQAEIWRRARLEVDLRRVPPVLGSRTKLGQVVLNLLANALQALPDRPRLESTIALRLAEDGADVRLEVEDNGAGIPGELLPRIFDPFFTTKKGVGSGLGLAITKRIVEEHGGRVEVSSEPGRGACFRILLPSIRA